MTRKIDKGEVGKPYQPRKRSKLAEAGELESRADALGRTIATLQCEQMRLYMRAQLLRYGEM